MYMFWAGLASVEMAVVLMLCTSIVVCTGAWMPKHSTAIGFAPVMDSLYVEIFKQNIK